MRRIQAELARLADENIYRIEYLLAQPVEKAEKSRELDFEVKSIGNGVVDEEMIDGEDDEDDEGGWEGFE